MKGMRIAIALLLLASTLLGGCWDQKSIQDLRYLSAIGIDFVNNQYVLYAQSTDLSTVAKQESSTTIQSPPATISIGKGETLQSAFDNLQKNSQIPIFLGFVSSLIFHERLLEKGVITTHDIMNRYGLIRYTKWVFATREPIDKVLSTHSLVGFSPLTSLLHQPWDVYQQRSFIEPLQFYRFISIFWEPSNTLLLPNLTLNQRSWKEHNQFISRLSIDGVHAIHRGHWKGYFPSRDLMGLRWMNPDTRFAGLIIRQNKTPKATMRIEHVQLDIVPITTEEHPRFQVNVHLKGFIRELMSTVTPAFIRKNSEEQVAEQIRGTFLKGVKAGADLYSLEESLFKKDYQAWRKYEMRKRNKLTPDSLIQIQVNMYLSDSGKMKMDALKYPDPLKPE
ncbi:Ger(x)C family germination protein [Brevibacillus sp. AG162]|uniref:Ger(x)C family spore germination protein n=1 Tax=Brevibacillus sp. AG162 TaxID=2572910 RepID=UPI0011515B29|nr:Ger(x)C family spore germination protein [Brevibacillus sp. AG162]TQK54122.1 Ger(x)C family germination protein [Brevibacillus sp. AG162]